MENFTDVEAGTTAYTNNRPGNCKSRVWRILKPHALIITTIIGAVAGTGFGFGIREAHPSEAALIWIGLPGELFMRMLKMMVLPLVIACVISGTTFLDPKSNGKVTIVGVIYIAATNSLGALIGVAAGLIAKPGQGEEVFEKNMHTPSSDLETHDIFVDLIRNLFPDNLFEASFSKAQTMFEESKENVTRKTAAGSVSETVVIITKYVGQARGANLLGLTVACCLFGMAAAGLKEKGRPLLNLFLSIYDTSIIIVRWLMCFTPIGVFSIIGVAIAKIVDVEKIFCSLGMFAMTIVVSLIVQQIIVFPLILLAILRKNPLSLYRSMGKAWMVGFATASKAVCMPEMIVACEVKQKMTKSITRFIIPLCLALSANGTAVFIACASIFAGNISGHPPTATSAVQIWLLTSISAMAIPGVPSSSIVHIIMILTSLDIPDDAVGLLLAIDWFLSRCHTTSNVLSACFTVAVTEKICHSVTQIEYLEDNTTAFVAPDICGINAMSGFEKEVQEIEANGNVHENEVKTEPIEDDVQNSRS